MIFCWFFLYFSPSVLLLSSKAVHALPFLGSCSSLLISFLASMPSAPSHPPHSSGPGWSFSGTHLISSLSSFKSHNVFYSSAAEFKAVPPMGRNLSKKKWNVLFSPLRMLKTFWIICRHLEIRKLHMKGLFLASLAKVIQLATLDPRPCRSMIGWSWVVVALFRRGMGFPVG